MPYNLLKSQIEYHDYHEYHNFRKNRQEFEKEIFPMKTPHLKKTFSNEYIFIW